MIPLVSRSVLVRPRRRSLDVRYGARHVSACAEFSREGHDENDPACGRGWAVSSVPPDASSATSTSITPTIQGSSANAHDFFNTLLNSKALVLPRFKLSFRSAFRVLDSQILYNTLYTMLYRLRHAPT